MIDIEHLILVPGIMPAAHLLTRSRGGRMQIKLDKAGCLWSIILSIVLTVLLNLALRACTH
jgi:hypothetical protein